MVFCPTKALVAELAELLDGVYYVGGYGLTEDEKGAALSRWRDGLGLRLTAQPPRRARGEMSHSRSPAGPDSRFPLSIRQNNSYRASHSPRRYNHPDVR